MGQGWHLIVALLIKHDQITQKEAKAILMVFGFHFLLPSKIDMFCHNRVLILEHKGIKIITMSYPSRFDIIHVRQIKHKFIRYD